jgi:hypothetical protein
MLTPLPYPTTSLLLPPTYSTVGVLTGPALERFGRIWSIVEASGLRVVGARAVELSAPDAASISAHFTGSQNLETGRVMALLMLGADVNEKVAAIFALACDELHLPLSSLILASSTGAAPLTAGFFGRSAERLPSTRTFTANTDFSQSACAIVLPHILLAGTTGSLLNDLDDGVRSSNAAVAPLVFGNMRLMDLTRAQAEEFLEVYKNVVPEYAVSDSFYYLHYIVFLLIRVIGRENFV